MINNAGLYAPESKYGIKNGFEYVYMVNYLGAFILTEQLHPLIKQNNGRVINLGSDASKSMVACAF